MPQDATPLNISTENSPHLMGILNVTPDSFSDGGRFLDLNLALEAGKKLLQDGASIIDVGGESTAPGRAPVSAEEEQQRILPFVQAFAKIAPLSIDTYKSSTARACLELGASMINDVSGLRADPNLPKVVAEFGAQLVIMHSKEKDREPHASESQRHYSNLCGEIADFLRARVDVALKAGVQQQKIILDPGMGRFLSHDPAYSWQLLREFDVLVEALRPFPLLIGTSRKGFLGGPLQERDALSQLTALFAVQRGASYIRTHNPSQAKSFLQCWSLTRRHPSKQFEDSV